MLQSHLLNIYVESCPIIGYSAKYICNNNDFLVGLLTSLKQKQKQKPNMFMIFVHMFWLPDNLKVKFGIKEIKFQSVLMDKTNTPEWYGYSHSRSDSSPISCNARQIHPQVQAAVSSLSGSLNPFNLFPPLFRFLQFWECFSNSKAPFYLLMSFLLFYASKLSLNQGSLSGFLCVCPK